MLSSPSKFPTASFGPEKMKNLIKWLSALVVLVAVGLFAYKIYITQEAKKQLDKTIASVAMLADVRYRDIDVSLSGDIMVSDIDIYVPSNAENITIGLLEILEYPKELAPGELPEKLHFRAKSVKYTIDLENYMKQIMENSADIGTTNTFSVTDLRKLGLGNINADFDIRFDNPATQDWIQFGVDSTYHGIAGFDISVRLGGMNNLQQVMAKSSTPTLYAASATYRELGLIRNLEALTAEKENKTLEQVRKEMLSSFNQSIDAEPSALDNTSVEAIRAFLAQPSTLVVSASPATPIKLDQLHLYNDADLPALLNIQVSYH